MTAANKPSLLSGREAVIFYSWKKAQSVLDEMSGIVKQTSPPKERAVSDYENLVSLINQNMKLWGIRVARMFGVEAWKSPQGTVAPDEFRIPRPEILLRI